MAASTSDNTHLDAPKLLDDRGGPWDSIGITLAAIPTPRRSIGLEVWIKINGSYVKYVWQNGIADADLVPFVTATAPKKVLGQGLITVVTDDVANTSTVSTEATKNSTDAELRDLSKMTGLLPVSKVSGVSTVGVTNDYNDLFNKPQISGGGGSILNFSGFVVETFTSFPFTLSRPTNYAGVMALMKDGLLQYKPTQDGTKAPDYTLTFNGTTATINSVGEKLNSERTTFSCQIIYAALDGEIVVNYTLPTATTSRLGGVIVGSNLLVQPNGTLSVALAEDISTFPAGVIGSAAAVGIEINKALAQALASVTAQKNRIDAILQGADSGLDSFLEALQRFVQDENVLAGLLAQIQAVAARVLTIENLIPPGDPSDKLVRRSGLQIYDDSALKGRVTVLENKPTLVGKQGVEVTNDGFVRLQQPKIPLVLAPWTDKSLINAGDGTVIPDPGDDPNGQVANSSTTGFVVVEPSASYVSTPYQLYAFAFYTADKVFISGVYNPTTAFKSPANAAFGRFSVATVLKSQTVIAAGGPLPYVRASGYFYSDNPYSAATSGETIYPDTQGVTAIPVYAQGRYRGVYDTARVSYFLKNDWIISPNNILVYAKTTFYDNGTYDASKWSVFPVSGASGPTYTLPVASVTTLGGVKQGDNVTIGADGTISTLDTLFKRGRGSGSVILPNTGNDASGTNTAVLGGLRNVTQMEGAAIVAGYDNLIGGNAFSSFIGAGRYGVASGGRSFIGAGSGNQALGDNSAIPGGWYNTVTGAASFGSISGGYMNVASNTYTFVGGGIANTAGGINSSVVGGNNNATYGKDSHIYGSTNSVVSADSPRVVLINCHDFTVSGQSDVTYINNALVAGAPVVTPTPAATTQVALNILWAALANAATRPVPLVFVGSSTTAGQAATDLPHSYVNLLANRIIRAYPNGGVEASILTDPNVNFSPNPANGVQIFNGGQGATTSSSYLTSDECSRIGALNPVLVQHMITSNDFANNIDPATTKANVAAKIAAINAASGKPCVHVLIQAYQRYDVTTTTYPWSAYGAAMQSLAAANPSYIAYFDLTADYVAVGVPSADPLKLMSGDGIHQNNAGMAFMADLLGRKYGFPSLGAVVTSGGGGTAITEDTAAFLTPRTAAMKQIMNSTVALSLQQTVANIAEFISGDGTVDPGTPTASVKTVNNVGPDSSGNVTVTFPALTAQQVSDVLDSSSNVSFAVVGGKLKLTAPVGGGGGGSVILYGTTGQNTDGAMTQKATSDELALRAPLDSPNFTGSPVLPQFTVAYTQPVGNNSTRPATTAFVATALEDYTTLARYTFEKVRRINNARTPGTYAIKQADAGEVLVFYDVTTVTLNANVVNPSGAFIDIAQDSPQGQITLVAGAGVTINYAAGAGLKTAGPFTRLSLQQRGVNVWVAYGGVA